MQSLLETWDRIDAFLYAGGEVLILIGGNEEDHLRSFEQVERVGQTDCGYCMPYENNQPIFVGRGLRTPLAEAWPRVKHFD